MSNNHFLKYPFVNERGAGCISLVKKIGLFVQCNRTCVNNSSFCKICSYSFHHVCIDDRIVGGFKNNETQKRAGKLQCYKKTLKKHGLTITKIKRQAQKLNLTLNMKFINELTRDNYSNRSIDVSVVDDTTDEEQYNQPKRGRGRPKKINKKTSDDLFYNMTVDNDNINIEEDETSDYESDSEIEVREFNYEGDQIEYVDMLLYIDKYDVVYNNLFHQIGTYYSDIKRIVDIGDSN